MPISLIGTPSSNTGTGAITLTVPVGYAAGDLLMVYVETENQIANMTTAGWTALTTHGSPIGRGTAAAAGATRLTIFYKWASASEATVTVTDAGDHTTGGMICIRGVDTNTPFGAYATGTKDTSSTAYSCPAITTTRADSLIINGMALDADANDTSAISTATNANLSSVTIQLRRTGSGGDGGGVGIVTGFKADIGSTGNTTGTLATTQFNAYLTLEVLAAPVIVNAVAVALAFESATEMYNPLVRVPTSLVITIPEMNSISSLYVPLVSVPLNAIVTASGLISNTEMYNPLVYVDLNGYVIERRVGIGGTWESLSTNRFSETELYDSLSLIQGVTYYYRVKRVIKTQESPWSNEVSVYYSLLNQSAAIVVPSSLSSNTVFIKPSLVGPIPFALSLIQSKNEISDELTADSSTISFQCNHTIEEWEARATDKNASYGVGVGNLVGSGGAVTKGTTINFVIDDEELILGDIDYQITIYLKVEGVWY